jgi:hypothetical protein
MDEKIVKLLYRSLDAALTPAEQEQLDAAVKKSKELKKEKKRLVAVRGKIELHKEKSFKPFFTEKVMQQINRTAMIGFNDIFYQSLFKLFKPVMVAAILIIIAISTYNIANTRQISLEGALAVPQVTLEQAFDPSLSLNLEE